MKNKRDIIYCVILSISLILILSGDQIMLNFLNKKDNNNTRAFGYEYNSEYNIDSFTKVTIDDLIRMNNSKEDFLFLLSSNDCGICNEFISILKEEASSSNKKIYYMSLNDLNKEDKLYKDLIKIDSRLEKHLNYVPYLTHFKDGKLESELIGKSSKDKINAFINA